MMPSVTIHNLPSRPAGSGLRLEEQQQQQESDQTQQDTATAELDARIASLQEQSMFHVSRIININHSNNGFPQYHPLHPVGNT